MQATVSETATFFKTFEDYWSNICSTSTTLSNRYNYANQLLNILKEKRTLALSDTYTIYKGMIQIINTLSSELTILVAAKQISAEDQITIRFLIADYCGYLSAIAYDGEQQVLAQLQKSDQHSQVALIYRNRGDDNLRAIIELLKIQLQQAHAEEQKASSEAKSSHARVAQLQTIIEQLQKELSHTADAAKQAQTQAELTANELRATHLAQLKQLQERLNAAIAVREQQFQAQITQVTERLTAESAKSEELAKANKQLQSALQAAIKAKAEIEQKYKAEIERISQKSKEPEPKRSTLNVNATSFTPAAKQSAISSTTAT